MKKKPPTCGARKRAAARASQHSEDATVVDRSDEFRPLKDEIIRADSRGRLTVGTEASEKQFRVLMNADGQILLDPVVVISEREVWGFRNLQASTSVLRGIEQAKKGDLCAILACGLTGRQRQHRVRRRAGGYGSRIRAFVWSGCTTLKCRRSVVRISRMPSRSAVATTVASTNPSGRSA